VAPKAQPKKTKRDRRAVKGSDSSDVGSNSDLSSVSGSSEPPRKRSRGSGTKSSRSSDSEDSVQSRTYRSRTSSRRESVLQSALDLLVRHSEAREASMPSQSSRSASQPSILSDLWGDPSRAPVDELVKVPEVVWRTIQSVHDPVQRTQRTDSVIQAVQEAYMKPVVSHETLRRFQTDHFGFLRTLLALALSASPTALADITTLVIRRAQWAGLAASKGHKVADTFLLEAQGLPGVRDSAFEKARAAQSDVFRSAGGRSRSWGGRARKHKSGNGSFKHGRKSTAGGGDRAHDKKSRTAGGKGGKASDKASDGTA
jgi:hypothetical protein